MTPPIFETLSPWLADLSTVPPRDPDDDEEDEQEEDEDEEEEEPPVVREPDED